MENLDAGKALQGGFYAVYDVHLAILPTAAGVGQSVLRWRYDRHPAAAVQAADYGANRPWSGDGDGRLSRRNPLAHTTHRQGAAPGGGLCSHGWLDVHLGKWNFSALIELPKRHREGS